MSLIANLAINLDARSANQQLRQFQQQSTAAGRAAEQLQAGTTTAGQAAQGAGRQFQTAANGLKYYIDATGRARRENGQFVTSTEAAAAGLERQGRAAQEAGGRFKELGRILASIGAGAIIGGLVRSAATFEGEVKKAAAIEGSGSFDKLRKSIEDVAAVAAGTPLEVAELATSLSRAGFSAQETSQALRGIVQGAEATAVPFEKMGSIVADTMRSFGIETSKTQAVVDILVKTANSSNQSITDVGEAMSYAASTAKSLGINVNDLSIAAALLADTGIRGSRAGTTLSTGLSRLQRAASGSTGDLLELGRGNEMLSKSMKSLGAEVLDAQGRMKPLDQVIVSLKRNFDKMDVGKRTQIANALFGEDAGRGWLSLLNNSESKIESIAEKIRNSGGAAGETQKQMMGFEMRMKVLGGNIDIVKNAIGSMLTSALSPFVDLVNTAIGVTQTWPKPLRDVAAGAAAAGLAVVGFVLAVNAIKAAAAIAGITSIGGALASVATAFGVAGAAAKGFAVALIANPVGLVVASVVALTVAAYNLSEPFKQFVDTIPQRFGAFWDSLTNDAAFAIDRATKIWEGLRNTVVGIIQSIQDAWSRFTNFFAGIWDGIKNFVSNALAAIGVDADGLASGMASIASGIESFWLAAFGKIAGGWRQTVAEMINSSNPLFRILKATGIADVGGAAAKAWFGDFKVTTTGGKVSAKVPSSNVIAPVNPPKGATSPGVTPPGAAGGSTAAGPKLPESISKEQLRQWLISQGMGRTSGDFTNAGHRTPNHMLNAMDMGFISSKYDSNYVQKTIEMERKLRATGAFGNQLFGPERDPKGHKDHLHVPTPGGRVKMTPGLASLMGLQGAGPEGNMALQESLMEMQAERQKLIDESMQKGTELTQQYERQLELQKAGTGLAGDMLRIEHEHLDRRTQIGELLDKEQKKKLEALSTSIRDNALAERRLELFKEMQETLREEVVFDPLSNLGPIDTRLQQLKKEMEDTEGQIIRVAEAFTGTLANSVSSAISGLIQGTTTVKQAFSDMFRSIGESFVQMATQMLAQKMLFSILNMFSPSAGMGGFTPLSLPGGGLLGGGSLGAIGFPSAQGNVFSPQGHVERYAQGGVVTAPTMFRFAKGSGFAPGLMGEAGPEAILPLQRTPSGDLGVRATLQVPYASKGNKDLQVPYTRAGEQYGTMAGDGMIRFESTVINNQEFVTKDEAERIGQAAASRGAEIAQRRMKNSPQVRRSLGIA